MLEPMQQLTAWVEEVLGLSLDGPDERARLAAAVARRASACGASSVAGYVAWLLGATGSAASGVIGGNSAAEQAQLFDLLLNQQTYFFREVGQLEQIAAWLVTRAATVPGVLEVWSAGCSSGEEVYTLAMLARERGVRCHILGTDVSAAAVASAERGRYHGWSLRQLPPVLQQRYCVAADDLQMQVSAQLREQVTFLPHNLMQPLYPTPRAAHVEAAAGQGFDAVICRNVLIYFSARARRAAVQRFATVLAPGGTLFLGASDVALSGVLDDLEPVAGLACAYRPRAVALGGAPVALAAALFPSAVQERLSCHDVAGARRVLEELLRLKPDHLPAQLTVSNLDIAERHFAAALAGLTAAQTAAPMLAEPHFLEGVLWYEQQDWAAAQRALKRALFLEPQCWPASWLLAQVFERLKQKAQAQREYRRTLEYLEKSGGLTTLRSLWPAQVQGLALQASQVRQVCQAALT